MRPQVKARWRRVKVIANGRFAIVVFGDMVFVHEARMPQIASTIAKSLANSLGLRKVPKYLIWEGNPWMKIR